MSGGANNLANLLATSEQLASGAYAVDVILRDASGNVASNRWTPFSYISAGSTQQDAQTVKSSAGTLGYVLLGNTTNSIRYVKVYDEITLPASTDTPVLRFIVPGSTAGGGSNVTIYVGTTFVNGIGFRITTGVADNDTGTASSNDVIVNLGYQ